MPEMSPPFGPAAQGEIYVGSADDLALDPDEWESRAKAVLEPGPFDYIAGGAGGESTMQANRDAFTRWRFRDLRNRYLPFILGEGIGQFTSDPVFRSRLSVPPEEDPRGAGAAMVAMFSNLGLRWDDLSWLRERTRLPLLAKGVLRGDDARRVLDAGFQGVIVSNHGGRQVDGAIAALDALVEVRDALGADAVVLMDSGIRRGADVIKALALGADAVLLGRPYVYGLAGAGQEGVERVIRNPTAEVDPTLGRIGRRDVNPL